MHRLVLFSIDYFIVFSEEVGNGSVDVSVVAGHFLEVEVSREVVVNEGDEDLLYANIW